MNRKRSPVGTNEIGAADDEFLHQPNITGEKRFKKNTSSFWSAVASNMTNRLRFNRPDGTLGLILFSPGDKSPGYCHGCPLTGHRDWLKLALIPSSGGQASPP